jgi:hypothetical protein
MKLQVAKGQGTIVKSADWPESEKSKAIGLDAQGFCNGYVKRLTDSEGNVYELRGTFGLAKHAQEGRGHSVTSNIVLVCLRQGEDGVARAVTQIDISKDEIVRVPSSALKAALRDAKQGKKVDRIEQSRREAASVFGE